MELVGKPTGLILPSHLQQHRGQTRGKAPDRTDRALAQQLLTFLRKGYEEGMWPDFVTDYRKFGLQDDLGLVYHLMSFARARGYGLGLKAAEVAVKAAQVDAEKALKLAGAEVRRSTDETLDACTRKMEFAQERLEGASTGVDRINALLDSARPPGV